MCRVFLSYGHDTYGALAERLKRDLDSAGLPTWFDADRLRPGGDWEQYIEEGLEWTAEEPGGGRFVLLMTPHSVRRPDGYCLNELARAIDRELPVVPVMVDTVEPPLSIARLQWLDMRGVANGGNGAYRGALERLRRALVEQDLDFEAVQSRLVRRLRPLSFDAEIHSHLPRFVGRDWVGLLIDRWLADDDADPVLWITGGPGAGKTALSAWLTTQRPELVAVHFCQHTNARKVDPRQATTSLAYQLTTQLPNYADRVNAIGLDTVLDENDAETLFDDLVVQPLAGIAPEDGRPRLLLVDALDEAPALARLICRAVPRLPEWLRVMVTSRPNEPAVALHLQPFKPHRLERARENAADLKAYIGQSLGERATPEMVRAIRERSEGSFLYARWVALEVAAGRLDPHDAAAFPSGLGGIYLGYFERQFADIAAYGQRQRPVLEAMCAAAVPLPLDELASMLGWSDYDGPEIVDSFGSLVTTREGALHAFHLSVLEWVSDRARAGPYWAAIAGGRRRLAEYGWAQYQAHPDAMPPYALHHAARHLAEADRPQDAASMLLDYRILRRRTKERLDGITDDVRAAEAGLDGEQARAPALVRSVFELALGILSRDPGQLASQLQARLLSHDEPAIRELVEAAGADVAVRALTPAVRQAGDPLTRTFRGLGTVDMDEDMFALSAVALDATRGLALAASEAGVVHAWSLSSGRLEHRLQGSDEGFSCSALDHARGRWVLGGWDGAITLVDLDSGTIADRVAPSETGQISDLHVHNGLLCVARSFEYGTRGALEIHSLEGLKSEYRLDVSEGEVSAVAYNADGSAVAVGIKGEVLIGPPDNLVAQASFEANVEALAYSPDGATLAVGLGDGTIRLVSDARTVTLRGHPIFTYKTSVSGLQFLAAGRRLASAGWDGALRIWDVETGAELASCHTDSKLFSLAVDATGRWALTGAKLGALRLWDLERAAAVADGSRHGTWIRQLQAVPERDLAVSGAHEADCASLRLWRLSDGRPGPTIAATGSLHAMTASPEWLSAVDDSGASTWPLSDEGVGAERPPARRLNPAPEWTWEVAMAPAVAVAARSGYPQGELLRWRAPAWKSKTIGAIDSYTSKLALSADGRVCAIDGGEAIRVFDLVEEKQLASIVVDSERDGDVNALAVLPAGTTVAIGTEGGAIALAEVGGEQRILRRASGDTIAVLAVSGDGTTLIAGTSGGRLELWSLARGTQVALFCGNESWTAAWVSHSADRIVAGDGLGFVHFLVRV